MDKAYHWNTEYIGPIVYFPAHVPSPLEVLGRYDSGAGEAVMAHAISIHQAHHNYYGHDTATTTYTGTASNNSSSSHGHENTRGHKRNKEQQHQHAEESKRISPTPIFASSSAHVHAHVHAHSTNTHSSMHLHRPVRCYLTVENLELTPDLLGLCGDERIMVSAAMQANGTQAASAAMGTNSTTSSSRAAFNKAAHGLGQPVCLGEMVSNDQAEWTNSAELPLPTARSANSNANADKQQDSGGGGSGSSSSSNSSNGTLYQFAKETPQSISFAVSGATYTTSSASGAAASGSTGNASSYRFTELCIGHLQALPSKQHGHMHRHHHHSNGRKERGGASAGGSPADSRNGSNPSSRGPSRGPSRGTSRQNSDSDDSDSDPDGEEDDNNRSSDPELDAAAGITKNRPSRQSSTRKYGRSSNAVQAQFQLGGVEAEQRGGREERKSGRDSNPSSQRSSRFHSAEERDSPIPAPVPAGFSTAPVMEYQRQQHQLSKLQQQQQRQLPLLASGTYEVPLYTEPTSITINQRASTSIQHLSSSLSSVQAGGQGDHHGLADMYSLADGVLVGRLIVKIVMIDDSGESDFDIALTSYATSPADASDASERMQTNAEIEAALRHQAHSLLEVLSSSNHDAHAAARRAHSMHSHSGNGSPKQALGQLAQGSVNTTNAASAASAALAAENTATVTAASTGSGLYDTAPHVYLPPLPEWVESEALLGSTLAPAGSTECGTGGGSSGVGRGAGSLLQQKMNLQNKARNPPPPPPARNGDPWGVEYSNTTLNGMDENESDNDDDSDASSTVEVQVHRSFYHYVGVAEAIACLSACSARISLLKAHSAHLERSAHISTHTHAHVHRQQHEEHNQQQLLTVMNVIMNLSSRLSQPSLCDNMTFSSLSEAISSTGGNSALWAFFHHTLISENMQAMIDIASSHSSQSRGSRRYNYTYDSKEAVLEDMSLLVHADNHAILRATCWALAVLATNGYVDHNQSSAPPPHGSSSGSAGSDSVTIAEDLLHTILAYTSAMIVSLLKERATVDPDTTPQPIYAAHTENYNSYIAQLVCTALECASILVPLVGTVGYEVASCINNVIAGFVAVYVPAPAATAYDLAITTATAAATVGASAGINSAEEQEAGPPSAPSAVLVSAMSALTLFLSRLLMLQPNALDQLGIEVNHQVSSLPAQTSSSAAGTEADASRMNTISTDYGVVIKKIESQDPHAGASRTHSNAFSSDATFSGGGSSRGVSGASRGAEVGYVSTASLISGSVRRWCMYLNACAQAPVGLNTHMLLPLQELTAVIRKIFCSRLSSGTAAAADSSGTGTDRGTDVDMLRKLLPAAPRRHARAPPGSGSVPPPPPHPVGHAVGPPRPKGGSTVESAYEAFQHEREVKANNTTAQKVHTVHSSISVNGGFSASGKPVREPFMPIVMGVDHVTQHQAAAAAKATGAGGGAGEDSVGPVIMAVRSVIDGTTTASSSTGGSTRNSTGSAAAAAVTAGQPLFDQQALVYTAERLCFLTAYTAGCDAISCMTNCLYDSRNSRDSSVRNGNGAAGGGLFDDAPCAEVGEQDMSISTFKAAKWARRLVSTANSARLLLARTLTAVTQCDMHQILAVTTHAGGSAGPFKSHKSQTQVHTVCLSV